MIINASPEYRSTIFVYSVYFV